MSLKDGFQSLVDSQGVSEENEILSQMNPMIIACVENFCRCVKVLFRHGFLFELNTEDLNKIEHLIKMDHVVANDWHLYYSLYFGSKHINLEAELGTGTTKKQRQTSYKKKLQTH